MFSQRDEIIVRIAEGADPTRILGKHKYKSILKAGWPYDPSPVSCVFVYNYQSNGDPSDRAYTYPHFAFFSFDNTCAHESIISPVDNWREHVPSEVDAPPDHFRTCEPDAHLHMTFITSLSYPGELRAPCPAICGTNPYHHEPPPDHLTSFHEVSDAKVCA